MSRDHTITFEMNGKSQIAHVKNDVPFDVLMSAINEGYEMCYLEDGTFMPELVDFAIEYENIKTLTDLDIGESANAAYEYIRAIDGIPSVDADFIADGIRAKVAYQEKLMIASAQSIGMSNLAEQLEGLFNDGSSLLKAGKKLIGALSNEVKKYKDVDLGGLVDKLTTSATAEKDIAYAVLDYQSEKNKILEQAGMKKPVSKKVTVKK